MNRELAYRDPLYAKAFSDFGTVLHLPKSNGYVLIQDIPGTGYIDAVGCYPLFDCMSWNNLPEDIDDVLNEAISLTIVTDPFAGIDLDLYRSTFDVMYQYKDHYVIDLTRNIDLQMSKHHRYYTRKALENISVEYCDPSEVLDQWCDFYQNIVRRHKISGMRCFSKDCFEMQFNLEGSVILKATFNGRVLGFHWYLTKGDVVYHHLVAQSPEAYEFGASYALHFTAIQNFQGKYRWLDMGAVPDSDGKSSSGLDRYKRGWSSKHQIKMPTYLCGKVLDQSVYGELSELQVETIYFPAYRYGEGR